MPNSIIISSVTPQGDSVIVTGTVNGVSTAATVSRAVLTSLATAILAQQYVAFKLLESAPQSITQASLGVTTGTVSL